MADETTSTTTQYDVDGYDIVTTAIGDLLNDFPILEDEEEIKFSTLDEVSGIAFYPSSGAVISSEVRSVTGKVNQLCNYPFFVVYRTSINNSDSKVDVKEFLDNLGKWLEQQVIVVGDESYELTDYPELTEGREIEEIQRQSPAYLSAVNDNNVQDWIISLNLEYRNIFYPNKV